MGLSFFFFIKAAFIFSSFIIKRIVKFNYWDYQDILLFSRKLEKLLIFKVTAWLWSSSNVLGYIV